MLKRVFNYKPFSTDCALLLLRVATGSLMLTHGWPKLAAFNERIAKFSDPIGLGSELSFTLTVFAETFCSVLVILGLVTRLALIPLMFTMFVVVFVVHVNDPFGKQELPLLYFFSFLTIFTAGPGKYSLDAKLSKS